MRFPTIDHLVRDNIRTLRPYASARSEYKGSAEVFLDANENPFPTGYNRYPDPLQRALKQQIAEIKGVDPEYIFLGNGSDEAIDLLLRIFCEPGQDHIITLPPTYGMYRVSADIAGVPAVEIQLTADFQPKVADILAASNEHSKLLFLCSPNNPTGNLLDESVVQQLIAQFPGVVVVDEAYIDFVAQGGSAVHWLEDCPNLVVLQTFSKAWGMAGIRLGMAFAQPGIIAYFNKVKPPYNINQLTQEFALQQLKKPEVMQAQVAELLAQRNIMADELERLKFVQRVYPSEANFLLVRVDDPQAIYHYLIDQQIIVRDRSKVVLCEGCLRVTVGTQQENQQLLQTLNDFLNA